MIQPPYLQPGDTVAITSTARWADTEAIREAERTLVAWGFKVALGKYITTADNQFAGNDAQRLAELHRFAADPTIKAVIFSRGGYGTTRIIDDIDWPLVLDNPKWYCGFSDVTALLCHLEKLGMKCLHSPMAAQFASNQKERSSSLLHFKEVLLGKRVKLNAAQHMLNRNGKAKGILIGGNLSILNNIIGTASSPDYQSKILFLEDLDEYLYHIDRMMVHLKRSGVLANLAGVVVGQMSDMNDNAVPFGKTAYLVIAEHLSGYQYPVAYGLPIGHENHNLAVPVGAMFSLNVSNSGSTLVQL